MTTPDFDIIVVGPGPVGMTAAMLMAERGYRTALIGPDVSASETRTAALLKGSITLMRHLGVWGGMESGGAPLRAMRLIDDTGRLLRAPTVTFESAELGEPYFGVNVPVKGIAAALHADLAKRKDVVRIDATVETTRTSESQIIVALPGDETITASLVVAADGRLSVCREAAGISTRQTRYPQTAFVLNLEHEREHDFISTEFHRKTGPFTLVPLPGRMSSLVCVVKPEDAEYLGTLDDDALSTELARQSKSLLGRLTPAGPSRAYPLVSQTADRFAAGRTVLVGEAAHIMPPIGAQGLNLGLRDVAALADAVDAAPELQDVARLCDRYQSARRVDVMSRMTAVDLLNRSLLSGFFGFQGARSVGLQALQSFGPLRRLVMREGMLPSYATPRLMQAESIALQ